MTEDLTTVPFSQGRGAFFDSFAMQEDTASLFARRTAQLPR